jgi:hypothetical protein
MVGKKLYRLSNVNKVGKILVSFIKLEVVLIFVRTMSMGQGFLFCDSVPHLYCPLLDMVIPLNHRQQVWAFHYFVSYCFRRYGFSVSNCGCGVLVV